MFFRNIQNSLVLATATALALLAAEPARAAWLEFGIGGAPMCPDLNSCPTLQASCESAAYQYWGPSWPGTLLSIQILDTYYAHCVISGLSGWDDSITVKTYNKCTGGSRVTWADSGCFPASLFEGKQCTTDCEDIPDNDAPSGVGNPIEPGSGRKFERVVDFTTGGVNPLRFVRTYNSLLSDYYDGTVTNKAIVGALWRSNFHTPRVIYLGGNPAWVERADGQLLDFYFSGGVWVPAYRVGNTWYLDTDRPDKLTGDSSSGWTFTDWNDRVYTFFAGGRLQAVRERNGYEQTLTYDGNGRVAAVTDSYGRELNFTYNAGGRLATMTDPTGGVTRYFYESAYIPGDTVFGNRLIEVTYPDDTPADPGDDPTVSYLYEKPGFRYALTGKLDENGDRVATHDYYSHGGALSSERAGGADRVTVSYLGGGNSTVTNALGQAFTYHFTIALGNLKLDSIDRVANAGVPAATKAWTYDANGYIASRGDWNGNVTTYVRDALGLETSRTEAAGTPEARTITTTWHLDFRVPTEVVAPGRTTGFTYDASGRVLSRTETDTTVPNGLSRTWGYAWDPTGLLLSVDGPRTGVADVTAFTWDAGKLTAVTDALGHVTQITAHDPNGRPLTVADPNGAVTDLAYDPRGRLSSVTRRAAAGDAVTGFTYDLAGQLTLITLPDGATLAYEYDAAHRLTAVRNGAGERIEYTLDALGNRSQEVVKSAGGQIVKTMSRTHDALGRLLTSIGAAGQTTAYAYDHNGNVIALTDPLGGLTSRAFDALDRLITSTDPLMGVTDTAYNARDDLISVADPRGIETLYTYDGFGNRIEADSPDAGVTAYEYDLAGNLTRRTDARGAVTEYAYDALNRVIEKTFPASPGADVAYAYDDPTPGRFGIGRLTRITDAGGATDLFYDPRGNVVRETRTIDGIAHDIDTAYDLADNPVETVYPSDRIVTYTRDAQGRVTGVTTQEDATAPVVTVAANIAYLPFGAVASLDYGNGQTATFAYDQDTRLTGIDTGDGLTPVQQLSYAYDPAGNITAIADALDAARDQAFAYDALGRLTDADGDYGQIDYSYDAVGNRTTRVIKKQGRKTLNYAYATDSNRLLAVSGQGGARAFTHDAAGNTLADDRDGTLYAFAYDDNNRLIGVDIAGQPAAAYTHNALGERVSKETAGQTTHYLYDRGGHLIAETDGLGNPTREYIHLNGLPLALILPGPELHTVHPDHLGTPQKMTDATGALTWDAQFRPFGEPHDITGTADNDQRFPGQLLDPETDLHYNYLRDYDPTLGRYIESDPIGLAGGLNSYAYVRGNPVSWVDPLGLQASTDIMSYPWPQPKGVAVPKIPAWARNPIGMCIWIILLPSETALPPCEDPNSPLYGCSVLENSATEEEGAEAKGEESERSPRERPEKSRKRWKDAYGEAWPKDPESGHNQDVHHDVPIADGGTSDVENIGPMPHNEHVQHHKNRGDFSRWGRRRGKKR